MIAPAQISVMVVDDHDVVREGLRAIINREPDMTVVGEAKTGESALGLLENIDPSVVVLDQRLPGMAGVEVCREIAERRLRTQIVMLSAFLEEETVEAALRAGARAYVVKDVEAAELMHAIRSSAQGLTTIDPKVGSRFSQWADASAHEGRRGSSPIPPRHAAVLARLVDGKSAREIADIMGLTEQTVRSYMRDIYMRLGVNSRAEAIAVAIRRRLV